MNTPIRSTYRGDIAQESLCAAIHQLLVTGVAPEELEACLDEMLRLVRGLNRMARKDLGLRGAEPTPSSRLLNACWPGPS